MAPPNPLFINDLEGCDVVIIKKWTNFAWTESSTLETGVTF